MKWYITGDTHGLVNSRLHNLEIVPNETALIILGDAGINYYLNKTDKKNKKLINDKECLVYCVRGNHEQRPELVEGMTDMWDSNVEGYVWYEPDFPNIRYFKDGYAYVINGLKTLVVGGAYSVDKWYRLARAQVEETYDEMQIIHRAGWFPQEQLTEEERRQILIAHVGEHFDLVLTHTCPFSWEPIDLFLSGLDQSSVDKSMELFFETLKNAIDWDVWLFGHYHADRLERPHVEQFFHDIESLDVIWERWHSENTEELPGWWLLDKSPMYYSEEK